MVSGGGSLTAVSALLRAVMIMRLMMIGNEQVSFSQCNSRLCLVCIGEGRGGVVVETNAWASRTGRRAAGSSVLLI